MFATRLPFAEALRVRRPVQAPAPSCAQAPSRGGAQRFTPADWDELSQRWRESSAFLPPRVIEWRARREVGMQLHGYPADEAVCSARRRACGAGLVGSL